MKIRSTKDAVSLLKTTYQWDREYVRIMLLDQDMVLLKIYSPKSDGSTSYEVSFNPYDVLNEGKKLGARYIILSHSHPKSVHLTSSAEDKSATRRIIEIAKKYQIKVIDHIIFSPGSYLSFKECGLMSVLS